MVWMNSWSYVSDECRVCVRVSLASVVNVFLFHLSLPGPRSECVKSDVAHEPYGGAHAVHVDVPTRLMVDLYGGVDRDG